MTVLFPLSAGMIMIESSCFKAFMAAQSSGERFDFCGVYFNLALIFEISFNIAFLRSVAVASSSLAFRL